MCTATYLPIVDSGFVLTISRDEYASRPMADFPYVRADEGEHVVWPRDPVSGGTWVACSVTNGACMLNGAFVPHDEETRYRISRGLILPRLFESGSNSADTYCDLDDVAPFTVIVAGHGERVELREYRWDGKALHQSRLDPRVAHIWSSCVIYAPWMARRREVWLREWVSIHGVSTESAREFHLKAGDGCPRYDLVMRRSEIRTLSIASVSALGSKVEMVYLPIGSDIRTTYRIPRSSSVWPLFRGGDR